MAALKNTVLLVEDEPMLSDMTRYAFMDAGFNVMAVGSAEEALGLAYCDVEFDLMFTDINLDGPMTGWELTESMHDMRPDLPIIATSGSASREEIAARVDGTSFVSKPYMSADVIAMAIRMIEEARAAQAKSRRSAPKLVSRLSA
jgi:two-component system, response regulator PdtaR